MNHAVLLLICAAVAALLMLLPRLRTVLVIVGVALAVALVAGPIALHHLAAMGGAR